MSRQVNLDYDRADREKIERLTGLSYELAEKLIRHVPLGTLLADQERVKMRVKKTDTRIVVPARKRRVVHRNGYIVSTGLRAAYDFLLLGHLEVVSVNISGQYIDIFLGWGVDSGHILYTVPGDVDALAVGRRIAAEPMNWINSMVHNCEWLSAPPIGARAEND